ncbi:GlcNAc-transferase family protein [Galactobacter valiniphilus]|uniref:GlcNAc-transferase family protein n=1 Tax=Galactobacter valiniphilus TaxID=2676122 RepID=UPI003734C296
MSSPTRVLIKIAAYRDRDLATTVASALSAADDSRRLSFAIVQQWGPETRDQLVPVEGDGRFSVLSVPWQQARGIGWARARCDAMYAGQEFCLQVDAHTRFAPGWDTSLEAQWHALENPQAVLSCYPGEYRRVDAQSVRLFPAAPHRIAIAGRTGNGEVRQDAGAAAVGGSRTYLVSGGFQFGPGWLCERTQHPPELLSEDELVQAARYFTHGVDVAVPTSVPLFHLYAKDKDAEADHGLSGDFAEVPRLAAELASWRRASRDAVAAAFADSAHPWWGTARPLSDFLVRVEGLETALGHS